MPSLTFKINGESHTLNVDKAMPLLWVLRDLVGLTGTKYSCGMGLCGACTVHVDGEAARSCVTPVSDVAGRSVTTIEGLATAADHSLQTAWIEERVSQCGYCQPGQIMAAAALLAHNPNPSDDDIIAELSDMFCRCGTYHRIRRAIHRAAEALE